MKSLKSHFLFNRNQRNGIFLLVLIIIGLLLIYFFVDFTSEENISTVETEKIIIWQRKIDSLKKIKAAENAYAIYPFNPNFISDYKGYTLGMSVEEIDKLHAYRKQDQWINSEEDFQEVTGVSDSLLKKIAPYFKFPDWVTNANDEKKEAKEISIPKQDLNKATAADLLKIRGVGKVLSARIVNYKKSIDGFRDEMQLHDVYGLKPEVVNRITNRFVVLNLPTFKKWDINKISVLELSELPYFDYELARKVVEYRKLHEGIASFGELTKIEDFPVGKIERIKLYLTID